MKHYAVMPQDWDYTHNKEIKEFNARGYYAPCEIKEIAERCGSLFPIITTKSSAIEYARGLKKRFPFVTFDLMEGENWGEMKLVKSF